MTKKQKTLLIVEDNAHHKRRLAYALSTKDHKIVLASDFFEARSFLKSHLHVDLLISVFKFSTGATALDFIPFIKKSKNPNTEILALAEEGKTLKSINFFHPCSLSIMTKPLNMEKFSQHVEKTLQHSSLITENITLKSHFKIQKTKEKIIGASVEIKTLLDLSKRVAHSNSTLLITGEKGTGKKLFAQLIHEQSPRNKGVFISVNCNDIPENLFESEFFGQDEKAGYFSLVQGGTLFIHGIEETNFKIQNKLLKILQSKIDTRVIVSSRKNLAQLKDQGVFRKDLYDLISAVNFKIPPLRNRKFDIPLLIDHFIKKETPAIEGVSKKALTSLISYQWPGNVAELETFIKRLLLIKKTGSVEVKDLSFYSQINTPKDNLEIPKEGLNFNALVNEFENKLILKALKLTNWNKNKAASLLNLNRTTLIEKIKKKGLKKPEDSSLDQPIRGLEQ